MSNNQSKPRIEAVTVLSKSAILACSNSIRESRLIAWAKLESWTAVEAAAIVLERDPDLISWEDVQSLPPSEEFTLQFKHVRRLILRATELSDDKSPSNIIRYLIANDVHVPSYVKDAIDTHGTEPPSDTRRRDRRTIDKLKKQVRRLEQSPEGRRQRNIQLVLARLAIVNAGYRPEKNSSIAKQVSMDLGECHAEISDDTVRSILQECTRPLDDDQGRLAKLVELADRLDRKKARVPKSD